MIHLGAEVYFQALESSIKRPEVHLVLKDWVGRGLGEQNFALHICKQLQFNF